VTPVLLADLLDRQADRAPASPALTRAERTWSYGELRARSLACAEWLRRHAVGRGDRVLVLAGNAMESVAIVFAAARMGALYALVSDQVRPFHLEHILRDCEPSLVLAEGDAVPAASRLATAPVRSLEELPRAPSVSPPPQEPACLSIDPVSLIYTSGSTAMPKAVVSTHRQVLFATSAIQARLDYRPGDVVFCCLPLSFDYGLYQAFLACSAGSHLVLGGAADAGPALLDRLREHGVTILPCVPSLAAALARLVERSGAAPERLRMVTNTGAALSRPTADRLRAAIPGLAVVPMFGLTECKRVSVMEPNGDLVRPGSVGRPLPDTEAYVVDRAGRRLPAGEAGELVVRGPHVMAGYWRAPELTASRFRRDEFGQPLLFSGDRCRTDADGYLYFLGRQDDLYKQNGFRVSAVEVEAAAGDIPAVHLAAVLPPSDGRGASLVVSGDVTPAEVLRQLAGRLEEHKLPARCLVVDDLPLGPNGKVDRRALAGLVEEAGDAI
jgi:amino acid adenylation domain-containing protein